MTERNDFAARIQRIEKISTATPVQRARSHTPAPGAAEDQDRALRRNTRPKRQGGFLSTLFGMVLGVVILGSGAVVFADDLDQFAPDGYSVSEFVDTYPLLQTLKTSANEILRPTNEVATTE